MSLGAVVFLVALFTIFLVFNEDPYEIFRFWVVGIAYLVAIILSVAWFGSARARRSAALITA